MAAFDHVNNMYDFALKPRLLCNIINEYIPDEKQHFSWSPSQLSEIVSKIKAHGLLRELTGESIDQKQIQSWKSAVDFWVNRVLMLVSSSMPDKCWAGICLLGLTCQECNSERLLTSYSNWFFKLLSFLQPLAESHFVKVASCASLSDLFTRLSGFSKMKKDGTSCAAKLIQPLLKLVNDDDLEDVWDAAIHLLCTLIISYPFSARHHYESIENAVASKILSGSRSFDVLKKFSCCLASLPKSRGDDDSWCLMMRKILLVVNDSLNVAFQGLEEETKRSEVVKLLFLSGKDPPRPLEGYVMSVGSSRTNKNSMQVIVLRASTLMRCCCTMLTSSYPVKVTIPVRLLLAVVERTLMVNGSLPLTSVPFVTAMQQESICSELPVLHSHSLELLSSIIKGVGSQLLPHAASIIRLISSFLKTCALPELRIKCYSISKDLLISMGVGMAVSLSQDIVTNALLDLKPVSITCSETSMDANSNASFQSPLQSYHRKRKRGNAHGLTQEHIGASVQGAEELTNHPVSSISLKIAALEALETLFNVGGALRSQHWRSDVDNLIISLAVDSFKEGWASDEKNASCQNETTSTWADLQVAVLRVLLASFLSSALVRPPYLSQGLELFRRGKQETGTKLAEFCAHALLALEVLIHPRVLPLADFPNARHNSFNDTPDKFPDVYDGGLKPSLHFGSEHVAHDAPESDDDELYQKLLRSDRESDLLPVSSSKNARETGEPSKISADNGTKLTPFYTSSGPTTQDKGEQVTEVAASADMDMTQPGDAINVTHHHVAADDALTAPTSEVSVLPNEAVSGEALDKSSFRDEVTVESQEVTDANVKVSESEIREDSTVGRDSSHNSLIVPSTVSLDTHDSHRQDSQMSSRQNILAMETENVKFPLNDLASDDDPFPDIVDEEPDSD